MADDLSALAGVMSVVIQASSDTGWTVVVSRPGGVTPGQMNTVATRYSVVASTETVKFV